jgi:tetratricopeptide (TPR) repeat protein
VSVCGAVGAALAIGLAGTLWQAREARAAEAFARAREQQAESLSRFLVDELFDSVEPERETREIGVVELLDRASTALEASSSTPPTEVEARIRHALGTIYNRLGEPGRAWPHNERAWEIRDALPRSAVPKAALSLNDSAYRLDRIEALPFDLRTLQNEAGVSPDDRWALRLREGNTLKSQHHFDAAIAVYEEIWRSRGTADTAPDDVLLAARHNIGVCLILAGRAAEGEERSRRLTEAAVVLEESAALRAARSGAASYPAMESRYEHAKALHHLQRLEEAIREYESLRAGLPRCVRNENFRYVELLESLAYAYEQTHRLEEAISAHREAVVLRTESPACGPGHPATLDGVGFYVDALLLAGRAEEAGAEVERAVRAAEQAGVSATSNSLIGLRAKMSAPPTKDP